MIRRSRGGAPEFLPESLRERNPDVMDSMLAIKPAHDRRGLLHPGKVI